MSQDLEDYILELHLAGMTLKDIARKLASEGHLMLTGIPITLARSARQRLELENGGSDAVPKTACFHGAK